MSDTPPPPQPQEAAFFTAIRNWGVTRSTDGVFGGVASGVGERIGLARVPARIILAAAAIFLSGIVLVAYAAAWALLPDRQGNIVIQNFGRGITNVGALIGIGIFALIGLFNLDHRWFGNGPNIGWDSPDVSGFGQYDGALAWIFGLFILGFGLLVLAGVIVGIIYLVRRSKRAGSTGSGQSPAGPNGRRTPPDAAVPGQPQPWEAAAMPSNPPMASATTASAAWTPASHPPVPPAPPRPPTRRVPGPGRRFYLITLAWVFISIAIVAITQRVDGLAVAPGLAWLALFTVGFGLILAAIAIAGRKLGFLGFLSIPLLIVGMLTAVNSGELGDAFDSVTVEHQMGGSTDYWIDGTHYDGDGNVIGEDPFTDPLLADPTAIFADEFQEVRIAPTCYDWELNHPGSWTEDDGTVRDEPVTYESNARLTYAGLTADTSADVTAEHTVVTVPAGTNVVIQADYNSQASIDWESRGLYCEFWGGETLDQSSTQATTYLSLINPGTPTLTLAVHDDQYANTIEIHETAPVASASPADAEPTSAPEPTVTPEGNQS